jgi:hypothetical protein
MAVAWRTAEIGFSQRCLLDESREAHGRARTAPSGASMPQPR